MNHDNTITVSALNAYVRTLLETDPVVTDIAIRGEISNFNRHFKTGHCYFTLKDEKAGVKAVMFRSYADHLSFQPKNGDRVVVRGRVSLYERDGAFQVYVEWMFLDGEGAIQLAFERLKERLAAQGFFAPEHKKPLPRHPRVVGLVTSKTGAALQDILNVAARRCPDVRFLLAAVGVQGEAAAGGIAAAVRRLDESGQADVIIVARGGGSAEDLWVFNDEGIAEAVFHCRTPVVAGVGHEIDFTILDFVADVRAPTPSAAAEVALPDIYAEMREIQGLYMNIAKNMNKKLDSCYNTYMRGTQHPALRKIERQPAESAARLTAAMRGIQAAAARRTGVADARFRASAALAASLNPYDVLARGYAMVRKGAQMVGLARDLRENDDITIHFKDGAVGAQVTNTDQRGAAEG